MTIEKLFESLDESVFTAELKQSLNEKFDQAVEEKAKIQAAIMADELAESKIDELDEKVDEYGKHLMQEAEDKIEEYKLTVTEKISEYLDLVVQEFVVEAKEALDESLKSEHADMLIEAFDSMLAATGNNIADIVEAKGESTVSQNDRVDKLVEEVITLKEANAKLIKMGLMAELCEGLTIVQAEKFKKFAELVEFDNSQQYVEKLEIVLESIKETNTPKEEAIEESSDTVAIWSHLV